MTHEELKKLVERVTKTVESWPPWKQNILANSGKAHLDKPRTPVDNRKDEK